MDERLPSCDAVIAAACVAVSAPICVVVKLATCEALSEAMSSVDRLPTAVVESAENCAPRRAASWENVKPLICAALRPPICVEVNAAT